MKIDEIIVDPRHTGFESLSDIELVARTEILYSYLMGIKLEYPDAGEWGSKEDRNILLLDLLKDRAIAKRLFPHYEAQTSTLLQEMIDYLDVDEFS